MFQWIKCSDRLPEAEGKYLVIVGYEPDKSIGENLYKYSVMFAKFYSKFVPFYNEDLSKWEEKKVEAFVKTHEALTSWFRDERNISHAGNNLPKFKDDNGPERIIYWAKL